MLGKLNAVERMQHSVPIVTENRHLSTYLHIYVLLFANLIVSTNSGSLWVVALNDRDAWKAMFPKLNYLHPTIANLKYVAENWNQQVI